MVNFGSWTLRWRGLDSNFQYAEAVKLVVAPFSCAGCLGRVGAPVGVGVLKVAEVRYHDRGDHPQPRDDFSCVVEPPLCA